MSGDWIKMRASLCTHPKVLLIADIIGSSTEIGRRLLNAGNGSLNDAVTSDVVRDVTLASLMRVWCATNEHTSDGVWHNSTLRTIDTAAGVPGFGDAMQRAGWAVFDPATMTVTMPNFLENNAPAKNNARSNGAERQARYRARKTAKSDVTGDVAGDVTVTSQSDTREEKRREEKKEEEIHNPPPPAGGVPPVTKKQRKASLAVTPSRPEGVTEQVWGDWLLLRKTKKAPVTQTVLDGAANESAKAGMSINDFLAVWCRRGSQGLEAAWLRPDERRPLKAQDRTDRQLETAALMTGAASPPLWHDIPETFDADARIIPS